MVYSNAHTHTTFCDAKSTAEEMVKSAVSLGFTSLGFSGHSYYEGCLSYCMTPEGTIAYQNEIRRLQTEYQDQLAIHLGLELDYYSDIDLSPYEYIIGSVHHYLDPDTGEFYSFDGSVESFLHMVDAGFHGDILSLAKVYYGLVTETITTPRNGRLPEIVGHFNLITKRNHDHHLIDESHPAYKAIAFEALEACANTGAIFEINTGAIARGYADAPYPNLEMLTYLHDHGSPIMINSDCHNAKDLACCFDLAVEMAKSAGYRSAVILGQNHLFEEVGLDDIKTIKGEPAL